MLVPLGLQLALKEEIIKITSSMTFKSPAGGHTALNVFEQNLPVRTHRINEPDSDEDEDEDIKENFPYCLVQLSDGLSKLNSPSSVNVILVFGIYDDSDEADGYKDIVNIIEKISERFEKNPVLDDNYTICDEVTWALPDEDNDTYPYFFGAMYTQWSVRRFEREDPFT